MAKLTPTTREDIPQIEEWIKADPFHCDDSRCTAEGLLTGNGELAFCLVDDVGPLCFVLLEKENARLRLSTQFGPEAEVNKHRLVVGLLQAGIPAIVKFGKQNGFTGIVFESVNESLISFMAKQGFFPVGLDDYELTFGAETNV